jgi:hypothetical protein
MAQSQKVLQPQAQDKVRKGGPVRRKPNPIHLVATMETDSPAGYEEIARLAYGYWEARGGGGSPEDDWFRAERDLKGASSKRSA